MRINRVGAGLAAVAVTLVVGVPVAAAAERLVVSDGERIGLLNNTSPDKVKVLKVRGLRGAQEIVGLDVRPCTGDLYAMAAANGRAQLYTVRLEPMKGRAKLRQQGVRFAVSGDEFGFDFNPVVDRIRVVSGRAQNLRVSPGPAPAPCPTMTPAPAAGTIVGVDSPLSYSGGAFAGRPRVTGVAYTNSVVGATTTRLLDIDSKSGNLFEQIPPNDGTLVDIGELSAEPRGGVGFDIVRKRAFASFVPTGKSKGSRLYRVEVEGAKVANLGEIDLKGDVTSLAGLRKG